MNRLPRHSLGVINGHTFKDVLSIEKPNDHLNTNGHEFLGVKDLQPVWLDRHNGTEFTIPDEHESDDLAGVKAITVDEEIIVANAFRAVLKGNVLAVVCSEDIGAEMPKPIVAEFKPEFNRIHIAA